VRVSERKSSTWESLGYTQDLESSTTRKVVRWGVQGLPPYTTWSGIPFFKSDLYKKESEYLILLRKFEKGGFEEINVRSKNRKDRRK